MILKDLTVNATNVEEYVRETLGEDTCDARRSVSNPNPKHPKALEGPCSFEQGLQDKFPEYKFRVYDADTSPKERSLGLLGDGDHLWTKDKRERQAHQV